MAGGTVLGGGAERGVAEGGQVPQIDAGLLSQYSSLRSDPIRDLGSLCHPDPDSCTYQVPPSMYTPPHPLSP